MEDRAALRNVVVLGASYAGAHAAEVLAKTLPATHRLILIERRTHFAHVYIWPRFATYEGHAHKSFVPFSAFLAKARSLDTSCPEPGEKARLRYADSVIVHAQVTGITATHVILASDQCLIPNITEDCYEDGGKIIPETQLKPLGKICRGDNACCMPERRCRGRAVPYDYLVYALGATLPRPLLSGARNKSEGVDFLKSRNDAIRGAHRILIIGAGALGIQFATDIADTFPHKDITIVHSRQRLLPVFRSELHDAAMARMAELGINIVLGERVICPSREDEGGEMVIWTESGRKFVSDLRIWATGQKPNSWLMQKFAPASVDEHGYIRVKRTLQLDAGASRIFAVGDCIAGFGAIKAGHTGWNQAEVAASNITALARSEAIGALPHLVEYHPQLPMIRLTLGLRQSISQMMTPEGTLEISEQKDLPPETSWQHMWDLMGVDPSDPCI